MALVQEHDAHQLSLSSPIPVPFRNPSRPHSRHSQFGDRPRMAPPSSPPSSPPEDAPGKHSYDDERANGISNGSEKISPLDPRRFTPTLHASLVAEILSLRRDLELKTTDINHLEESLYNVKAENDTLTVNLAAKAQETRTLKHEMKLLEGGTQTALIDVAQERDRALEAQSDLRSRLETSQKRTNAQQEETHRKADLWQRERQMWENDRRQLERQVHVMEGRLKSVLNEIASLQTMNESEGADQVPSLAEVKSRRHYHRRQASTTSTGTFESEGRDRSISSASVARANSTKTDCGNLADELAFDEDETEEHTDFPVEDGFDSSDALPEERSSSVLSRPMDLKARKLLGLSTDNFGLSSSHNADQDASEDIDGETRDESSTDKSPKSGEIVRIEASAYRDTGVQCTPPPSPSLEPRKADEHLSKTEDLTTSQTIKSAGHEPDRSTLSSELLAPSPHHAERLPSGEMISTGCQTVEYVAPLELSGQGMATTFAATIAENTTAEVRSMATQTDNHVEAPGMKETVNELSVPIIAIHPPTSRPATPNTSVVLPPRTRSASCQVSSTELLGCRSIAVQTDVIRVDKRVFSPASSARTTESTSVAINEQPKQPSRPRSAFQENNVKLASRPLREPPPIPPSTFQPQHAPEDNKEIEFYLSNNDSGPLTKDSKTDSKRPLRTSSLFAGFDMSAESESPPTNTTPFDDDDIFTRPTVSYTLKAGKMVAKQSASPPVNEATRISELAPEGASAVFGGEKGLMRELQSAATDKKQPPERPRPLKLASTSKQPNFRRAAMVSSSTAAHQTNRVRSPSLPTMGARPPFPVPTRNSSRNLPLSGSEGTQSPTRMGRGQIRRGDSSTDLQGLSLRKVRSAASLNPLDSPSEFPQSPELMSPLSDCSESPSLPPLPSDDVTWPREQQYKKSISHRFYDPPHAESIDSTFQQTTVVDAIAQTMVGEWMWKYIRKRKSFGVSDSRAGEWELGKNSDELSAHITSTGVRHKRWVWIEPYERAVMWSSKQPTSGPALLGKGGRKLAIQSVLDVRDDNPLPKSAGVSSPISPTGLGFNRSILILTPQRALKFTAVTQERHYVWLNALSFLSHSPLSINDLSAFPPNPPNEYPAPAPPVHGGTGSLRRSHVRDSIRVAKSKDRSRTRPGFGGPRSFTADGILRHKDSSIESPPLYYAPDSPITNAADPPVVPRHSARKRANTATSTSTKGVSRSRPAIPGAFRSYSANNTTPAMPLPPTSATLSIASSDMRSSSRLSSARDSLSRQPSENNSSDPPAQQAFKFFDNIGTVRMEAFIKHEERDRKPFISRGFRKSKKKDRAEILDELLSTGEDPFKGF